VLSNEADRLKRVIVCTPSEEYFKISNLKLHNILEVADREKALDQHDSLKNLLNAFGADVIDVPELTDHPNSVFTRDTALCTPEGYIELLPGIKTREAEGRWMASALDQLGEPCAGQINYPGTVDGGDVVLCGHVAFVGHTVRTNDEGCRQLSDYLPEMGYEVRVIPLPDTILHLDKVLMPVDPGKLIVCGNIVPKSSLEGFDAININFDGTTTANIICLGDGELIVGDTNLEAIHCLNEEQFTIHLIDISEFVKGAGGPNCLIMPLTRDANP
jgi:dimethylargininase